MSLRKISPLSASRQIAFFCVVLLLCGCFTPRFSPIGDPRGVEEASQICADIMTQRKESASLRVLADATLRRGSEAVSFRYAIVLKAPDSFRVDILPPTGAFTLGLFVFHNGKAVWLDSHEKTFSEAEGESDLFERFIGLPGISRPVVEGLLYGTVPSLECSKVRVYLQDDGDVLLLDSASHVGWRVMQKTPRVREVFVLNKAEGRTALKGRVEYSTGMRPERLELEVFDPVEARGELYLTKFVENPQLSDRLFEVTPPTNYERVE